MPRIVAALVVAAVGPIVCVVRTGPRPCAGRPRLFQRPRPLLEASKTSSDVLLEYKVRSGPIGGMVAIDPRATGSAVGNHGALALHAHGGGGCGRSIHGSPGLIYLIRAGIRLVLRRFVAKASGHISTGHRTILLSSHARHFRSGGSLRPARHHRHVRYGRATRSPSSPRPSACAPDWLWFPPADRDPDRSNHRCVFMDTLEKTSVGQATRTACDGFYALRRSG